MKQYDSYNRSEVSLVEEIPNHWKIKKLKHVVSKVGSGVTPSGGASVYLTEGVPLLRSQNIHFDGLRLEDLAFISEDIDKSMKNSRVEAGDVLLNITGASIGRCYFLDKSFGRGNVNQHVCIIRPIQETVTTKFLYYLLRSKLGQVQIDLLQTGANREGLNFEQLRNFYLTVPIVEEQTAITAYLDDKTAKIDTLIRNKQKLIELLKEEKSATINDAVTKGINLHIPLKSSGIEWLGDIPAHWEVKKLKYVATINPQKGASLFDKSSDEKVVFLPMEKVSEDGQIQCDITKPISELWNGFTYFEKNDVIVAKITPCFENGKGALLRVLQTQIGFGSTEFHVIRPTPVILPEFLFYLTRTHRFMNLGEASMTGAAGQKRVPTDFIEHYLATIPPLDEQNEIVQHIEAETARIDYTISRIEKEIDLMQEYRTALISEVVTGQVKVVD